MNEEQYNEVVEFSEADTLAPENIRLDTKNNLSQLLPSLNKYFDDLNTFLEEKEETFSEELKDLGAELLKEVSERINAINRLNKVLITPEEEVFISDIELCAEFIDDTKDFEERVKDFMSST